jgi:hypothetical protein
MDRNRSAGTRTTKGPGSAATSKLPSDSVSKGMVRGETAPGQSESEPQEFPIPFAISGVKPNPAVPQKSSHALTKQKAGLADPKTSVSKATTQRAIKDDNDDDDDPDELPPPKAKQKAGESKTAAPKNFRLDPQLLERALQNRNANRQNPN